MNKSQQGFTLIELITVIILLGILSAFAISRFPSSQSYSTTIIKNQFIASARLAQQTSLARSSTTSNVTLSISEVSEEWNLVIAGAGGDSYTAKVDKGNEQIRFGTNLVSACSALTASPLTLVFDGDGNRIPRQNLRVCIDSDIDYELCISPSGYAYEGTCLP
ncbi:MAG: type II secretion system protein [Oleispira antarctica]|nr:type II secretion system protein [Oleispira antarctica]MBQ0794140.1 type II secretion system protein [Oleispira antarctica]